jgi:hypothetical protein
MNSKVSAAAAIATGLFAVALPVHADEVWQNGPLTVIWEAEGVEGYAVFSFTLEDAKRHRTGRLFLYGLVGSDQNRATFGGYWTSTDVTEAACPMAVVDAEGTQAWAWGPVELTFNEPAFPSGWQAALGRCFDEALEFWSVEPVVGGPDVGPAIRKN